MSIDDDNWRKWRGIKEKPRFWKSARGVWMRFARGVGLSQVGSDPRGVTIPLLLKIVTLLAIAAAALAASMR